MSETIVEYDPVDCTANIQAAIDSGVDRVIIPNVGSDWLVDSMTLASNQEILFEDGVKLLAISGGFLGKNDAMFIGNTKSGIQLTGAGDVLLQMRKADYLLPPYVASEFRHGIALFKCSDVEISGLTMRESGGDGLHLAALKTATACTDVHVHDCIFDGNYRQGMSVISAVNLLVEDCVFSNTRGTAPQHGVDIEPEAVTDKLSNVVIQNCVARNNTGSGFSVYLRLLDSTSDDVDILFDTCQVIGADRGLPVGGILVNGPGGTVEFRDCTVNNTSGAGVRLLDVSSAISVAKILYDTCTFSEVANDSESPLQIDVRPLIMAGSTGGVEFRTCAIYDEQVRSFVGLDDDVTALDDLSGLITYHSPHNRTASFGDATQTNFDLVIKYKRWRWPLRLWNSRFTNR